MSISELFRGTQRAVRNAPKTPNIQKGAHTRRPHAGRTEQQQQQQQQQQERRKNDDGRVSSCPVPIDGHTPTVEREGEGGGQGEGREQVSVCVGCGDHRGESAAGVRRHGGAHQSLPLGRLTLGRPARAVLRAAAHQVGARPGSRLSGTRLVCLFD